MGRKNGNVMKKISYSFREFENSYDSQLQSYLDEYEDNSELEFCNENIDQYKIYLENVRIFSEGYPYPMAHFKGYNMVDEILDKVKNNEGFDFKLCNNYSKSFNKIIVFLQEKMNLLSNDTTENKANNLFRKSPFTNREHFDLFLHIEKELNETKKIKWTLIYEHFQDVQEIKLSELKYMTFIRENFAPVGKRTDKTILNRTGLDLEIKRIVKKYESEKSERKL